MGKNVRVPDLNQDSGNQSPLLRHFLEGVFDIVGVEGPVLGFKIVARPADGLGPDLSPER